MTERFAALRREYLREKLSEESLAKDPFEQFEKWFKQAVDANVAHPDGMTLATSTADGGPDARIVLLKGIDGNGLRFYTNYMSAKGRQLELNNAAALLFFWPDLERQIKIKGTVQKLQNEESDSYFSSRPRGAQIAAIASPQSQVIESRSWLERKQEDVSKQFEGQQVERPQTWGGYLFVPREFEFWQGRENRLHDRLSFRRRGNDWHIFRLAP